MESGCGKAGLGYILAGEGAGDLGETKALVKSGGLPMLATHDALTECGEELT